MAMVADAFGRGLHDLRVSVTDRCNFRCLYCMPREVFGADHAFLPRSELLSFEEITRVVASFARAGVSKVRLTGGEPLLRHDLHRLIAMLVAVPGITDIALTTNGSLLEQQAAALKAAGLHRITVSLDSLDPAVFARLADTEGAPRDGAGGHPSRRRGGPAPRQDQYGGATGRQRGLHRGAGTVRARARAPGAVHRVHGRRHVQRLAAGRRRARGRDPAPRQRGLAAGAGGARRYVGEVATRYRYVDGAGEIGAITSITNPFCATCTRARLSAIGEVYTCLFATHGHDLRGLIRGGASDAELDDTVHRLWSVRTDRYSAERTANTAPPPSDEGKVEMSYIGG